jgi:YHS domain-containing protein
MFRTTLVLVAMLASVFTFGIATAADATDKALCPVTGKAVDPKCSADYKAGKVYFCCGMCPGAFKANTAKFAAKANHQLLVAGQATQVKCPLAGRDVNTDTVIDVGAAKVCFCCNMCKGKATAVKGDAQINLIFSDANFAKGFEVKKPK